MWLMTACELESSELGISAPGGADDHTQGVRVGGAVKEDIGSRSSK